MGGGGFIENMSNFTENSWIDFLYFTGLFQMICQCKVIKYLHLTFLDFYHTLLTPTYK